MDNSGAIKQVLKYFIEHEDAFNECVEQLDRYNGWLSDDVIYDMDELDELFYGKEPSEVLRRAFYGYDDEYCYVDEYGQEKKGEFNPNRDYFYFSAYGNLISTDHKVYGNYLDENTVIEMATHRHEIDYIDEDPELSELFDQLKEMEEEDDF